MNFGGLGVTFGALGGTGVGGAAPATGLNWGLLPNANIDIDFLNNRAVSGGSSVSISTLFTCTRAAPATTYYEQANGSLISFAANTIRTGNRGLLVEETRTNVVLWNRDLTNAAWTKTNITAAKNQTGVDGTATAASSLTATAANGTCLQAITLASSARWQTVYVKRITGTGVVNMTMDNGTTWTAIPVTSSWVRVAIPTQTLANPTVGFRIVTSGDAVAIDFVQNEDSSLQATSPLATTTASVTRSNELVNFNSTSFLSTTAMTIFSMGSGNTPNYSAIYQMDFSTDGSNDMFARQTPTGSVTFFARNAAFALQWSIEAPSAGDNGAMTDNLRHRYVHAMALNDIAVCTEDGILGTDNAATVPQPNRVSLGSQQGGSCWNGYIERFAVYGSRLSDANLQILSASLVDFVVLVDGDSIPQAPAQRTSWPSYIHSALAPLGWAVWNAAIPASSIGNAVAAQDLAGTARTTKLDGLLTRYKTANPTTKTCTVIMVGHNDYVSESDSTSTFLTQLAAYLDARKAAGHSGGLSKLAVVMVTPATDAGLNTWRGTVNTALLTWVGVHCDYVVNLNSVSGCADVDASNTAFWTDGIHPSAAQAQTLAVAIKAQALDLAAA